MLTLSDAGQKPHIQKNTAPWKPTSPHSWFGTVALHPNLLSALSKICIPRDHKSQLRSEGESSFSLNKGAGVRCREYLWVGGVDCAICRANLLPESP